MKDATKRELHIFQGDIIEFLKSKGYDIGEDYQILYVPAGGEDEYYIRTEDECSDRESLIAVTYYKGG